jgi:hypothetical protein
MTETPEFWDRLWEKAVRLLACPWCKAQPTERCHAQGDLRPYGISKTHWDRVQPLFREWEAGFTAAQPTIYETAYKAGVEDGYKAGAKSMRPTKVVETLPINPAEATGELNGNQGAHSLQV